jgi:ferredoxin
MFLRPPTRHRPVQYGSFPLETLPRDDSIVAAETLRPAGRQTVPAGSSDSLTSIARHYASLYAGLADAAPAPSRAPVPDDLERRAADVKGLAHFLDAAHVGICAVPRDEAASVLGDREARVAIVLLIEDGRVPEADNLAHTWVSAAVRAVSDMRAAEIAAVVAGHIRQMGWPATFDWAGASRLDLERLAVLAGIAVRTADGIVSPYLGDGFSLAAVTTTYALAVDRPLAPSCLSRATGLRYWLGTNGAQSGRERNRRARRRSDSSRYPMEQVKRVPRPTTLILDDEVPRVPKRAAFFERALQGDLGAKAQRERGNFAFKHPSSRSMLNVIRRLVPHQDGPVATPAPNAYSDAAANARAIKSLSYFLGSDLTGICEIPRYAWYSHKEDGQPIEMYHRYAVVMLIDQGFDTMEGASGDDWISATQSMRGYLRGAEIAGVMAALLRSLGFSARSQTNADSDVLHIPLILWAGLGELSRIGELVLNPFVGPRFKSVVLTTDMPLAVDEPIDFGLQYFCNHCLKCARECPCDAISWGDSVMFNGYEMWKLDVERCTRYRLTNSRGAACGRCMKTCPLNKVVDGDGPLIPKAASWLGIHAFWLKPLLVPLAAWLDDKLGNGKRNLAKKWWLDHEVVVGVTVAPKASNERDIDPKRFINASEQKIAYYHANAMPPPNAAGAWPLDRHAALAAKAVVETPAEARARAAAGGTRPAHYVPTPSLDESGSAAERQASPYASSSTKS